MSDRCQRASEVDLVAFLDAPRSPEWEEFQAHTEQCAECGRAVAELGQVQEGLRTLGKSGLLDHPSETRLMTYWRSPQRLPEAERRSIQEHLSNCRECIGDLASVEGFAVQRARGEQADASVAKVASDTATGARVRQSLVAGLARRIPRVVLHPAFGYAVALLLAIPALRYFTQPIAQEPVDRQPELSRSGATVETRSGTLETRSGVQSAGTLIVQRGVIPPHVAPSDPRMAALKLLSEYKAAHEACDIKALRRVWEMDYEAEQEMTQRCSTTRALALLIDVRNVTATASGDRAVVKFLQVLVRTNDDNRVFQAGPVVYSADVTRHGESGEWAIVGLSEIKSEGGG